MREAGVARERVLGALAHALGLTETDEPVTTRALAAEKAAPAWRRESWRIPEAFAELEGEGA